MRARASFVDPRITREASESTGSCAQFTSLAVETLSTSLRMQRADGLRVGLATLGRPLGTSLHSEGVLCWVRRRPTAGLGPVYGPDEIPIAGGRRNAAFGFIGDRHGDRLRQIGRGIDDGGDATIGVGPQQPRADRGLRRHDPELIHTPWTQRGKIRSREDKAPRATPERAR